MNEEKFKAIISGLKSYEMTYTEERFIHLVEERLRDHGTLTEQQESILEGLYREKRRWSKRCFINKR